MNTDKNGLGAGNAEVLLGSSLLEQHPPAVIDSRYRGARAFVKASKIFLVSLPLQFNNLVRFLLY